MRSMAVFVIFSVVVACSTQVFATDCTVKMESIRNCNDCIRCGGNWCNKGEKNPCTRKTTDSWCSGGNKESLPSIATDQTTGDQISPNFYAVSAPIGYEPRASFTLRGPRPDCESISPSVKFINSTQTDNYSTENIETVFDDNEQCKIHLTVLPRDFCQDNGGKYEYLFLKLRVDNVTEEATIKYHVPCACSCSDHVIQNAPECNGKGDFSCGVCTCHDEWTGENCSESICQGRGDINTCIHPHKDKVVCAGNGVCGKCDRCVCFNKGEGWQYFDQSKQCEDLGLSVTLECDSCLHDPDVQEGPCPDCHATMQPCNSTLLQHRDHLNRTLWVKFEDSEGYMFAAMKDDAGQTHIMKLSSCKDSSAFIAGNVNVTVPTVLGVLAVVCAVAAVGGYMAWKARAAPAPLNASQYQELDGPENSTGVNPLYKSPNSFYNNPLWQNRVNV